MKITSEIAFTPSKIALFFYACVGVFVGVCEYGYVCVNVFMGECVCECE